jgi:hypothetical protein
MLAKALDGSGKKNILDIHTANDKDCRHERFTIPSVCAGVHACTPI